MKNLILRGSNLYYEKMPNVLSSPIYYLMFNLPYLCNYRCLKCCNIKDRDGIHKYKKILSLKIIEQLFEEAGNTGFKVLVIAGEGEPTLNKNFKSVVKLAARNKLIPYIFTNGTCLDNDNINFLAENKASLIISLDSINNECYSRLSGTRANLDLILSNIQDCRKIYKSLQETTIYGKVVSLAINTVATQINLNEIDKINKYCSDDIVFVCNQPTNIGLAEKNWKLLYGNVEGCHSINNIVETYAKEHPPLGSTSDSKWCAYLRNGVSIGYDGSILACAYATDTKGFYGFYKNGKLTEINRVVMKSIKSFYSQFNHSRCVLRHPSYKKWIENQNLMILNNKSF